MPYSINFNYGALNSKALTTGLAVGLGATTLIGCIYLQKKRKSANVHEYAGDGRLESSTLSSCSLKNGVHGMQGGDDQEHEIKKQEQMFGPITSPPVFPCFNSNNRTLLAYILGNDHEIFMEMRYLKSRFGATFDQCIQVGVDCPMGDHPVNVGRPPSCGIAASDADCYRVFEKLFGPIVDIHRKYSMNPSVEAFIQRERSMIKSKGFKMTSVAIQIRRNLDQIPFAPRISRIDRRYVYNLLEEMSTEALANDTFKIYLLSNMDSEPVKEIEELDRLDLLKEMSIENKYRTIIGQHRDPLDARAVGLSKDKSCAVVFNVLDHLVLIGRDENGDIDRAYRAAQNMLDSSETWLKKKGYEFAFREKFGYLCVMPEMAGTGVSIQARISVDVAGRDKKYINEVNKIMTESGFINVNRKIMAEWIHFDVEMFPVISGSPMAADRFHLQRAVRNFTSLIAKVQEELNMIEN